MNKKLARLVLAVQRDITEIGIEYSYAKETVYMLIVEYWHSTSRADEMHDLVAEWRNKGDYASAVALTAWLLAQ